MRLLEMLVNVTALAFGLVVLAFLAVLVAAFEFFGVLITGLVVLAEVDHRVPLFAVWSEHRSRPWPELLAFWGAPNLQVINKTAHLEKCAEEATARAKRRIAELDLIESNTGEPQS